SPPGCLSLGRVGDLRGSRRFQDFPADSPRCAASERVRVEEQRVAGGELDLSGCGDDVGLVGDQQVPCGHLCGDEDGHAVEPALGLVCGRSDEGEVGPGTGLEGPDGAPHVGGGEDVGGGATGDLEGGDGVADGVQVVSEGASVGDAGGVEQPGGLAGGGGVGEEGGVALDGDGPGHGVGGEGGCVGVGGGLVSLPGEDGELAGADHEFVELGLGPGDLVALGDEADGGVGDDVGDSDRGLVTFDAAGDGGDLVEQGVGDDVAGEEGLVGVEALGAVGGIDACHGRFSLGYGSGPARTA